MRSPSRVQIGLQKFCATRFLIALCLYSGWFSALRADVGLTPPMNAPAIHPAQRLELLDGSILRGHLRGINSGEGLSWVHPNAKQPIIFKPENLAWIRFPQVTEAEAPASKANCQFRFSNGDEFFGNLVALSETDLEMETWFGGKFKTSRKALHSVRFFPKGVATVYEGPTGLEGWTLGKNQNPESWKFSDGALVANAAGTLGRDLQLPDASSLEFDLAWNAPFSLLFTFYTEAFEGFTHNTSSYMFYINPGSVSLQRIVGNAGSSSMGRTETIMSMLTKKSARMEFRGNKAENLLELLVDGKLVNQWKDTAGWVAKGSGVLFYAQTDGSNLKISNLKVSEWDGNPGSEITTNAPLSEDQILLVNRDKVSGKLIGLHEGKLKFTSAAGALEIPLQRVTQISLADARSDSNPTSPWEIQAAVTGGGKISFALEKWDGEKVFGQNKNFGAISLNLKSIRQIRFNSGKEKVSADRGSSPADLIWEINEP